MTYQPYGQAAPIPVQSRPRNFKAFGITYLSVRGLVLVLLMVLLASLGALVGGGGGSASSDLGAGLAAFLMVLLVWMGYCVAGGVLAIKGNVAGVYMGLVDAALTTVLAIIGAAVGDEPGGVLCWLVPNGAIVALGVMALKQRYGVPQQAYGQQYAQPVYGAPAQYAQPQPPAQGVTNWNPQFAPPHVQARVGYPLGPAPQWPAAPQAPVPAAQREGTSAVVPSPKMAALGIMVLAASVDPDISQQALVRARAVAAKLLGPAAQARIQRQLAAPVQIMDVDTDLVQHTMILNEQANDAMKANVIKAAEYVLKGAEGVAGLGEQFMATLKQQLGV